MKRPGRVSVMNSGVSLVRDIDDSQCAFLITIRHDDPLPLHHMLSEMRRGEPLVLPGGEMPGTSRIIDDVNPAQLQQGPGLQINNCSADRLYGSGRRGSTTRHDRNE